MKSILVNPNLEPKNVCPNCNKTMDLLEVGHSDYYVCKRCNAGFVYSDKAGMHSNTESVYKELD